MCTSARMKTIGILNGVVASVLTSRTASLCVPVCCVVLHRNLEKAQITYNLKLGNWIGKWGSAEILMCILMCTSARMKTTGILKGSVVALVLTSRAAFPCVPVVPNAICLAPTTFSSGSRQAVLVISPPLLWRSGQRDTSDHWPRRVQKHTSSSSRTQSRRRMRAVAMVKVAVLLCFLQFPSDSVAFMPTLAVAAFAGQTNRALRKRPAVCEWFDGKFARHARTLQRPFVHVTVWRPVPTTEHL